MTFQVEFQAHKTLIQFRKQYPASSYLQLNKNNKFVLWKYWCWFAFHWLFINWITKSVVFDDYCGVRVGVQLREEVTELELSWVIL